MQRLLVAQHNPTRRRWYVQNLSQFFLAPKEPGAGSAVAGGASREYHLYLILSLIGVGDTQKLRAYRNLSIIGDCLWLLQGNQYHSGAGPVGAGHQD
jgi:hypothetical protein